MYNYQDDKQRDCNALKSFFTTLYGICHSSPIPAPSMLPSTVPSAPPWAPSPPSLPPLASSLPPLPVGRSRPPWTRPQRYEEFYSGTVRYGIFAKSRYTGIFRYGISLIFSYRDFWKLFGIFRYFFIGAKSDQFRIFHNCLSFCINASCPRNISSSSQ